MNGEIFWLLFPISKPIHFRSPTKQEAENLSAVKNYCKDQFIWKVVTFMRCEDYRENLALLWKWVSKEQPLNIINRVRHSVSGSTQRLAASQQQEKVQGPISSHSWVSPAAGIPWKRRCRRSGWRTPARSRPTEDTKVLRPRPEAENLRSTEKKFDPDFNLWLMV